MTEFELDRLIEDGLRQATGLLRAHRVEIVEAYEENYKACSTAKFKFPLTIKLTITPVGKGHFIVAESGKAIKAKWQSAGAIVKSGRDMFAELEQQTASAEETAQMNQDTAWLTLPTEIINRAIKDSLAAHLSEEEAASGLSDEEIRILIINRALTAEIVELPKRGYGWRWAQGEGEEVCLIIERKGKDGAKGNSTSLTLTYLMGRVRSVMAIDLPAGN